MIFLSIPGFGDFEITHLLLDVNGTLAVNGVLVEGVVERIETLRDQVEIKMLTANTHGKQHGIDQALDLTAHIIERGKESEQKATAAESFGAEHVIAIGNGANDAKMLEVAAIGIVIIGGEGANLNTLGSADVAVTSILDALDLLINPRRLVATLRR